MHLYRPADIQSASVQSEPPAISRSRTFAALGWVIQGNQTYLASLAARHLFLAHEHVAQLPVSHPRLIGALNRQVACERPAQGRGVLWRTSQPLLVFMGIQNDGHAIMHLPDLL